LKSVIKLNMFKFLILLLISLSSLGQIIICHENQNYRPYVEIDVNGNSSGILTNIIKKTFEEAGVEFKLVSYPWKRCITELRKGRVHAIYAAIWSEERDTWLKFPKIGKELNIDQSIWKAEYPIFIRKGSNLKYVESTFSNLVNGVSAPPGYVAAKKLKKIGAMSKSTYIPKQAFPILAKGRIDGYVVERNIGLSLLDQLSLESKIDVLSENFLVAHWFLPFNEEFYKENETLVKRIWNNIPKARRAYEKDFSSIDRR